MKLLALLHVLDLILKLCRFFFCSYKMFDRISNKWLSKFLMNLHERYTLPNYTKTTFRYNKIGSRMRKQQHLLSISMYLHKILLTIIACVEVNQFLPVVDSVLSNIIISKNLQNVNGKKFVLQFFLLPREIQLATTLYQFIRKFNVNTHEICH